MGIAPHLVLRGTTYYFRMAVPRHLVKKVGRAEVSTSLRTVHRKEATRYGQKLVTPDQAAA
jgi:hypothetical protein